MHAPIVRGEAVSMAIAHGEKDRLDVVRVTLKERDEVPRFTTNKRGITGEGVIEFRIGLEEGLIVELPEVLRACDERQSHSPSLFFFEALGKNVQLILAGRPCRSSCARMTPKRRSTHCEQ